MLVENSHHLRTKGLGRVLKDLACLGYDACWGVLSAQDCGANHERKRIWIVAHSDNDGESTGTINDETRRMQTVGQVLAEAPNAYSSQCKRRRVPGRGDQEHSHPRVGDWWQNTSHLDGMDDEVAHRMDRLKAIGNGQVPLVAAVAFQQLSSKLLATKEYANYE